MYKPVVIKALYIVYLFVFQELKVKTHTHMFRIKPSNAKQNMWASNPNNLAYGGVICAELGNGYNMLAVCV